MPPLSNALLTLQTDQGQDAQGENPRGFEGVGGPHELWDHVDEQRPEPGLVPGGDANVQLVRPLVAGRRRRRSTPTRASTPPSGR